MSGTVTENGMGGPWQIRPAVPADLPDLVRLERASFACPWSEDSLRHDLVDHPAACYLAACTAAGTLVGYAAFWRSVDVAMITNIAVDPAWRGRGIGRQLLAALVGQAVAEGFKRLVLEVRPSSTIARRLYESAGFAAIGVRRGYYLDNHEDAIIMQKNVD
jgi:[ribosomal protein S18]-alanine N-acetyltransferase